MVLLVDEVFSGLLVGIQFLLLAVLTHKRLCCFFKGKAVDYCCFGVWFNLSFVLMHGVLGRCDG